MMTAGRGSVLSRGPEITHHRVGVLAHMNTSKRPRVPIFMISTSLQTLQEDSLRGVIHRNAIWVKTDAIVTIRRHGRM